MSIAVRGGQAMWRCCHQPFAERLAVEQFHDGVTCTWSECRTSWIARMFGCESGGDCFGFALEALSA